nr:hypothetical protein 28 [bacterium]
MLEIKNDDYSILKDLNHTTIHLPPTMKVIINNAASKAFIGHIIILKDKFITIEIRISYAGGGTYNIYNQPSLLITNNSSLNTAKNKPCYSVFTGSANIWIEKETNILYKHHKGMEERENFFNNIVSILSKLNWKNIEKETDIYLTRTVNKEKFKNLNFNNLPHLRVDLF